MKRYILLPLLAIAFTTQAQDTYMNERLTNNSGEVIGTARYVGMGGALGALGALLSRLRCLTGAANHCGSSQNHHKHVNLFHSFFSIK